MAKWKRLSDAALKDSNFELCEAASVASNDYAGLLLMYSAIGNLVGMESLAKAAEADGKTNIAFSAYLLTGNVEACADILISSNRLPEAAFFARTYVPSRVDEIVSLWKADLAKISESAAEALVKPFDKKEAFPDFDIALQVEKMFLTQRDATKASGIPSSEYLTAKEDLELNLIDLIKSQSQTDGSNVQVDVKEIHSQSETKQEESQVDSEDPAIEPQIADQESEVVSEIVQEQIVESEVVSEIVQEQIVEQEDPVPTPSTEVIEEAPTTAIEQEKTDDMDDFGDDWE